MQIGGVRVYWSHEDIAPRPVRTDGRRLCRTVPEGADAGRQERVGSGRLRPHCRDGQHFGEQHHVSRRQRTHHWNGERGIQWQPDFPRRVGAHRWHDLDLREQHDLPGWLGTDFLHGVCLIVGLDHLPGWQRAHHWHEQRLRRLDHVSRRIRAHHRDRERAEVTWLRGASAAADLRPRSRSRR